MTNEISNILFDNTRYTAPRIGDADNGFYDVYTGDPNQLTDVSVASSAIAYLQDYSAASRTDPFMLNVGFFQPHIPWVIPQEYYDMYPLDEIMQAVTVPDDRADVPADAPPATPAWANRPTEWAKFVQAYLASVTFMDEQLGRLIAAIENNPSLSNNTTIVLVSDHGQYLGEKSLLYKNGVYEQGLNAPLIIVDPDHAANGPVDRIVSFLDIAPTVLRLAGIAIPEWMDGRSVVPLIDNPNDTWDDIAISIDIDALTVRTDHYRYNLYIQDGEELFDEIADPHEFTNLANTAEFAEVKAQLRALLDQYMDEHNYIRAEPGATQVNGTTADDTIPDLGRMMTLHGDSGDDTYLLRNDETIIVENPGDGRDLIGIDFTSYTMLDNVEDLFSLEFLANYIIHGNASDNRITVNATSLGQIWGGDGDDLIRGSEGGSYDLYGEDGNDTLSGLRGADNLFGGAGNDSITANSGNDVVDGGTGNDTLDGADGNDRFRVDAAGDVVRDSAGTDTVESTISYTLGSTIEALVLTGSGNLNGTGNALNNSITGNADANSLVGNDGNDTLIGGDGNDTLVGGTGNDNLVGGSGNDLYRVDSMSDIVSESGGGGTDAIESAGSFTLGTDIEGLTLTGSGNINGTGNALANTLSGNSGANSLSGGVGNDTINGGDGNDTLDGGSDDDSLTGGNGNDSFIGGDGNDRLDGGAGTDTLVGGGGNDYYRIDALRDVVNEAGGSGIDTVESSVSFTLNNDLEVLILNGSLNASGTGNALDNLITGNGFSNSLIGADGNDTLNGAAGNDTLSGGTGNDSLDGGDNNDWLTGSDGNDTLIGNYGTDSLEGGDGFDMLQGGFGLDTLRGGAGNDSLLGGDANDLLFGDAGNDTIYGDIGTDSLDGGADNDILIGETGIDTLTGGLGNDTFRYTALGQSSAASRDIITDFTGVGSAPGDVIDLVAIDANQTIAGDQAFSRLITGGSFTAIGQLRVEYIGSNTRISANTDANFATSEFEVQVNGVHSGLPAWVLADFLL